MWKLTGFSSLGNIGHMLFLSHSQMVLGKSSINIYAKRTLFNSTAVRPWSWSLWDDNTPWAPLQVLQLFRFYIWLAAICLFLPLCPNVLSLSNSFHCWGCSNESMYVLSESWAVIYLQIIFGMGKPTEMKQLFVRLNFN